MVTVLFAFACVNGEVSNSILLRRLLQMNCKYKYKFLSINQFLIYSNNILSAAEPMNDTQLIDDDVASNQQINLETQNISPVRPSNTSSILADIGNSAVFVGYSNWINTVSNVFQLVGSVFESLDFGLTKQQMDEDALMMEKLQSTLEEINHRQAHTNAFFIKLACNYAQLAGGKLRSIVNGEDCSSVLNFLMENDVQD